MAPGTLVTCSSVQLGHDPELFVVDVLRSTPDPALAPPPRKPVRPLDVVEVADLERALCARGDFGQHLAQQFAPRMPWTCGQPVSEALGGCPSALNRPADYVD